MNFAWQINVKEGVNAINFARESESVYFDRSCQNGAFNNWNTPNANWLQDSVNGEYCRNGRGGMYYVITNVGHAMPELVSKLIQDLWKKKLHIQK